MMEYAKRSKNGDAGEYFSAFSFTRALGWPYRMLPVDLGVDAEIEVMDANGVSTSDIIKLQIKTFDSIPSTDAKSIYVDDRHIDYWKKFCVPIIIVCVDLSKAKLYWKAVTATDSYLSGGASRAISLSLSNDELTPSSAQAIRGLATPHQVKDIETLLDTVREQYRKLDKTPAKSDYLEEIDILKREFDTAISKFEDAAKHYPWKVGLLARREVELMVHNARTHVNNTSYHHAVTVNGM